MSYRIAAGEEEGMFLGRCVCAQHFIQVFLVGEEVCGALPQRHA